MIRYRAANEVVTVVRLPSTAATLLLCTTTLFHQWGGDDDDDKNLLSTSEHVLTQFVS